MDAKSRNDDGRLTCRRQYDTQRRRLSGMRVELSSSSFLAFHTARIRSVVSVRKSNNQFLKKDGGAGITWAAIPPRQDAPEMQTRSAKTERRNEV